MGAFLERATHAWECIFWIRLSLSLTWPSFSLTNLSPKSADFDLLLSHSHITGYLFDQVDSLVQVITTRSEHCDQTTRSNSISPSSQPSDNRSPSPFPSLRTPRIRKSVLNVQGSLDRIFHSLDLLDFDLHPLHIPTSIIYPNYITAIQSSLSFGF